MSGMEGGCNYLPSASASASVLWLSVALYAIGDVGAAATRARRRVSYVRLDI